MSERLSKQEWQTPEVHESPIEPELEAIRGVGGKAVTQVLLYSGGWDSYLASQIYPEAHKLYVDLKTPYSQAEIDKLPEDTKVMDLDLQQFVMPNGHHIPQRNAIFALLGTGYGMTFGNQDIEVIMAGMKEDINMSDKNPEYFKELEHLINLFYSKDTNQEETFRVKVKGFFEHDKVSLWEAAGKPDMRNIVSCYDESGDCRECLDCKRRLLLLNHLYPGEYDIDVDKFKQDLEEAKWLNSDKV